MLVRLFSSFLIIYTLWIHCFIAYGGNFDEWPIIGPCVTVRVNLGEGKENVLNFPNNICVYFRFLVEEVRILMTERPSLFEWKRLQF